MYLFVSYLYNQAFSVTDSLAHENNNICLFPQQAGKAVLR